MNSPKNDVITARNSHRPTLAGTNISVAPPSSLSDWLCFFSQGFAVSLRTNSHQPAMPAATSTNMMVMLTSSHSGLVCLHHRRIERLVLRDEIVPGARHAVVIGPAIDNRQMRTPVAMLGGRVRRLPFERGRIPGI